ncbi:MAG: DUF3040 domain-containing protein [Nocardioides sp.]|nr:DUF3040 domain-containing protein [Nocardioides sp.]
MPLSEEELRLLEQMERALVEEDPKFASTLRGTAVRRTARRRTLLAAAGFLVGIVLLMTGAIAQVTVLGIVGFVVMLGAAYVGITSWRGQYSAGADVAEPVDGGDPTRGFSVIDGGRSGKSRGSRPRPTSRPKSSGSFMQRMEQRWQRRRDEGQGL